MANTKKNIKITMLKINEYDFADYEYTEGGKIWKDFHNMIKPLEGYPELVSKKE